MTKNREEVEKKMLKYIKKFFVKNGRTPSLQEIADGLGYNSKPYMKAVFDGLENKGYVKRYGKQYTVTGAKITFDEKDIV